MLKGYKTFLIMAPIVALSFLDAAGTIDLKPILIGFGLSEAQAAAAPGAVALLAILLRSITSTPPMSGTLNKAE